MFKHVPCTKPCGLLDTHVHNFGQWTRLGELLYRGTKQVAGYVQKRTCKDCGLDETREHWLV